MKRFAAWLREKTGLTLNIWINMTLAVFSLATVVVSILIGLRASRDSDETRQAQYVPNLLLRISDTPFHILYDPRTIGNKGTAQPDFRYMPVEDAHYVTRSLPDYLTLELADVGLGAAVNARVVTFAPGESITNRDIWSLSALPGGLDSAGVPRDISKSDKDFILKAYDFLQPSRTFKYVNFFLPYVRDFPVLVLEKKPFVTRSTTQEQGRTRLRAMDAFLSMFNGFLAEIENSYALGGEKEVEKKVGPLSPVINPTGMEKQFVLELQEEPSLAVYVSCRNVAGREQPATAFLIKLNGQVLLPGDPHYLGDMSLAFTGSFTVSQIDTDH